MVQKIILVVLVAMAPNFSFGQLDTTGSLKKGKHKVFIKLIKSKGRKKLKGFPIAINDSGIWVTSRFYPGKNNNGESRYKLIFVKAIDMERIHFRRKGTIGWGIVAGSVVGVVAGVAIASNNTEPDDGWAAGIEELGGGIFGLETGAILGGIIGAQARKRFKVAGNPQKFLELKQEMANYLPGYSPRQTDYPDL